MMVEEITSKASDNSGIAAESAPEEIAFDYDLSADAVAIMRHTAKEGLGFNCTFVDDDMTVLVGLAQRAVLAGLATDFEPAMQRRFLKAATPFRQGHERALGRRLGRQSWWSRVSDKFGITSPAPTEGAPNS